MAHIKEQIIWNSSMHKIAGLALPVVFSLATALGHPKAAPPVPFYTANVNKLDKISTGSVVITTKDSLTTVCGWYRKTLSDQNGETTTKDGAHIFYTNNGATVDVEPGNRFAPDTTIGLVWDVKKFGPYTGK